jgi:hypothetical protein
MDVERERIGDLRHVLCFGTIADDPPAAAL